MGTLIQEVRIYSQRIGMEFGREKYAILVIKSGKRHLTDAMELPNQDKIRTHKETETNKYFGILEVDTIKQFKMEILKKSISREPKNYSRSNYITRTLSKNKYLGSPIRKIFGTILEVDQRRT